MPMNAKELQVHAVAVTVKETAPGTSNDGMQATIVTQDGIAAKGLIRENMKAESVKKMRTELPLRMVAVRVHHDEGMGLEYRGVIQDHTCIAPVSERQAQRILTHIKKDQEMEPADLLQVVLQDRVNEESRKKRGSDSSQSGTQKRAMEQEQSYEKRAKKIQDQWNKMSVVEIHECMKV